MTEREATERAQAFIRKGMGRDLRVLNTKREVRDPSKWGVVFESTSPAGNVVDGPIIIMVDDETGVVQSFNDYFEEMWKRRNDPSAT